MQLSCPNLSDNLRMKIRLSFTVCETKLTNYDHMEEGPGAQSMLEYLKQLSLIPTPNFMITPLPTPTYPPGISIKKFFLQNIICTYFFFFWSIYPPSVYFSTIVLVVLNEVLLYPIFEQCMSRMQRVN